MIRQTFGSTGTYAALLKRGATWRRLLRGEIHVRAIGATLARRGLEAAGRRLRRLANPISPGGSVARRVARLRRRAPRSASSTAPAILGSRPCTGISVARPAGPTAPRRTGDDRARCRPQLQLGSGASPARAHLRALLQAVQEAGRPAPGAHRAVETEARATGLASLA